MELGTLAEWFGAIGTLLAVVVALVVAFRDGRLRRKAERWRQAELISVWPVHFGRIKSKTYVYISNASKQPVFDVLISYGVAYGAGEACTKEPEYQRAVLRVPPGEYFVKAPKSHGGDMYVQLGFSISFRDINGRYWRRDARGVLAETSSDPFTEMDVSQPISKWELLDPIAPIERP